MWEEVTAADVTCSSIYLEYANHQEKSCFTKHIYIYIIDVKFRKRGK